MTKSFADIKNLNPQKVRLGAGAPAIGIPFFWPSAAMPNTVMDEWSDMVFLKWNGATFSATEYPKLALVIPGLRLNDVRGEFIRVWDDGRGVDIGRALLSAQESSKLHEHLGQNGSAPNYGYMTVANPDSVAWDNGWSVGNIPNFSSGSAGSNLMGMRPRNVAFNFLVRAK
ncbi:phage tail protein [Enterobacter roggenkampii]|uniref:phage tail protein n=1 Tax=Enterobacter roggenkampii TaxID=1812935 RepID=UPI00079AFAA0|nr:phage tail protein [Enterobacter roggenkampii]SAE80086.1 Tail Collar domain-containing protein [Enterobacter roggenkampii]